MRSKRRVDSSMLPPVPCGFLMLSPGLCLRNFAATCRERLSRCWRRGWWRRLTRRPGEIAPAQDMAMEMWNGFAGMRSVVNHQAVASLFNAQFGGDVRGFQKEMSQDFFVPGSGLGNAGN